MIVARRFVVALLFAVAALFAADPVAAFAQTSPSPSASDLSSPSPGPSAPATATVALDGNQYLALCLFGGVLVVVSVATLVAAHGRPVKS